MWLGTGNCEVSMVTNHSILSMAVPDMWIAVGGCSGGLAEETGGVRRNNPILCWNKVSTYEELVRFLLAPARSVQSILLLQERLSLQCHSRKQGFKDSCSVTTCKLRLTWKAEFWDLILGLKSSWRPFGPGCWTATGSLRVVTHHLTAPFQDQMGNRSPAASTCPYNMKPTSNVFEPTPLPLIPQLSLTRSFSKHLFHTCRSPIKK